MSLTASGTLGGILTASIWKGVPYMRLRVVPSNPRTSGQTTTRYQLGAIAKGCAAVLTSIVDSMHAGSAFFQATRDAAPSGQSWISWLQQTMFPLYGATATAYAALSGTVSGRFVTEAGNLGLSDYVPTYVGSVTVTNGMQLYILASFAVNYLGYTGFAGGLSAATTLECTTFGTYVATTA